MGGLIAMPLAALPGNPIRKLVLNDVGPALDMASLKMISEYIGQELRWASYEDAATYIRAISVPFGPHTDEEWSHLAKSVLRQLDDGQWTRHYDLRLAEPFKNAYFADPAGAEALLWGMYDAIQLPDPAAARRPVGPADGGDGPVHEPARPAREAGGVRRHRPCADPDA